MTHPDSSLFTGRSLLPEVEQVFTVENHYKAMERITEEVRDADA